MEIVTLLVALVNLGLTGYILVRLTGKVAAPSPSDIPAPTPTPPTTYDTSSLLLCEPERRAVRHEVSFHGKQPPTIYTYAGKRYRYRSKLTPTRFEYVEVR